MTPTERNAARDAINEMIDFYACGDGSCPTPEALSLSLKALDALDASGALLRDVRDHVQQCCGCLTYGDWLDKIRAAIGDAG